MARGRGKHRDNRRKPTQSGRKHKNIGIKNKGRKFGKHKPFKTPQESVSQDYDEQHLNPTGAKRRKVEGISMVSSRARASSDEDSANETLNKCFNDPYNQLLSTFSTYNNNFQKKAIESDESDESTDTDGANLGRPRPMPRPSQDESIGLPLQNKRSDFSSDEHESESDQSNELGLTDLKKSTNRSSKNIQVVAEGGVSESQDTRPSDDSTPKAEVSNGQTSGISGTHCDKLPQDENGGIIQRNVIKAENRTRKTKSSLKTMKCGSGNDQESEGDSEIKHIKDDVDDSSDPFSEHFCYDMDDSFYNVVSKEPQDVETCHQNWPVVGHFLVQLPKPGNSEHTTRVPGEKMTLLEEKKCAQPGCVPKRIPSSNWPQLCIKQQIKNNIMTANAEYVDNSKESVVPLSPLQRELFSLMYNYQDVYYPHRTLVNGEEIRFVYCLHAVNHILTTRSKILHHNAKLSKKDEVPDEFRDQGLVRPKVVILVPFRESALRVVKLISAILFPQEEKGNVMHMKRFIEEHSGEEIAMPKKHPRPEDYEATFVGNTDDTFRIGMTVTRKSLKLYADFYSADIIVASPLGLRMIVGAEGEADRDYDFLASIELLVLDQTELFIMQNWDHVLHILDHFHLQPKESHGTDFSRVRSWALNGWTRYYRQTLVFSSLLLPEISALVNKKCHNYAGKIKVINSISTGTICQVVVQLPQVFYRIDASSVTQAIDARLDFFVKKILPQFKDPIMSHTMVYIPSYFDFVRIRNYFKREDIGFVQVCEYSKEGKVARARDMFFHTEAHFLLYSERFHFFRRFRIKGIRHIIFYQPPTFPHFYSEMCNLMHEANQNKTDGNESNMTVTVLYSKYDVQQLAALVGTERAKRMVSSERSVHMFMTGD